MVEGNSSHNFKSRLASRQLVRSYIHASMLIDLKLKPVAGFVRIRFFGIEGSLKSNDFSYVCCRKIVAHFFLVCHWHFASAELQIDFT
ncbi:MAG: hypothetical protein COA78_26100 [Blastopirellula sp.]|nr:MAG: hypothetical protein COA78_26100 [Blastopirellula sp.]